MQKELFINNGLSEDKTKKKLFTKPEPNEMVIKVDKFDTEGFEIVRREFFSKANCPAVTLRNGKVNFNIHAIRKLDKCSHILIAVNFEKKLMVVEPSDENNINSLQWSRVDKHDKVVPRTITGKLFTGLLYTNMKWNFEGIIKMLGTLVKAEDKNRFLFNLINAEAYLNLAQSSADDPNRHERVPLVREHFMPKHWEGHYGLPYEESKRPLIDTFEGMEGFVKITIPKVPTKKSTENKVIETANLFTESVAADNADKSNNSVEEAQEYGTI